MTTRPVAVLPVLPLLAMVGSAALWGASTVLTKAVLDQVAPFSLLALQLCASAAALGLAGWIMGGRAPWRRGAAGLLEPGLAYGVGVPGLWLTGAAAASVLAATEPALVLLLGWALFGDRPSGRLVAAAGVAIAGVALVALPGAEGGERRLEGDLLVLLGTAFAALYVLVSARQVQEGAAPLTLAFAQHAWGLGLALPLLAGAVALGWERPVWPEPAVLGLALLSGLLQYALPFWLYLVAVREIPASRAALVLTLTPVFGVAGGVLVLGETVLPLQMAGAALILGAVLAVRRG